MISWYPKISMLIIFILLLAFAGGVDAAECLVPNGWDPKLAGDRVMKKLISVTKPPIAGAHDPEMVLIDNNAYIVATVNDSRAGESPGWSFIYVAMSIVNTDTLETEQIIPFARSKQVFENETLPTGSCFVTRIIQKDDEALRCYFASEKPGERQSQIWYRDFDIPSRTFENRIYCAKLKTSAGIVNMQPKFFYADAVLHGFRKDPLDFGLYIFDSFKIFDGKTYIAINNFPNRQNALAVLNEELDTFEVIGHYNEPQDIALCESAVNRLPDGTWLAIVRNNEGDRNYRFTTSVDGRTWTVAEPRDFIPNGTSSKPTFDKFGDVYYLGWQEATKINNVNRSVFNIDVSRDGQNWERKYRFETTESFQYPSFHEHNGNIWVCVTQGSKERIMFGILEHM
jgi:hypothetical protein